MKTTKRAEGTFSVTTFAPQELPPQPSITTRLPVTLAIMEKRFQGEVVGKSVTVFTSAFDQALSLGTYVAMESFEGSLNDAQGTFNFLHSASSTGADRTSHSFVIVPSSGSDDLAGIHGGGGISVEEDGTHRIWFDFDVP